MTPENEDILEIEEVEHVGYTYRVDSQGKRINGMIDGIDSVLQAVQKIITTERFSNNIYSTEYGAELENLIGQDRAFVSSVLQQRITEALTVDERITSVEDFTIIERNKDTLEVSFTVTSTESNLYFSMAVNV